MNPLIFTRYLYSKTDVRQSLLIAMLDNRCDKALFWCYELYYSGFEEETIQYVLSIYEIFYEEMNRGLLEKLEKVKENGEDLWVGSLVTTLCGKAYNICSFVETYIHKKCILVDTKLSTAFTITLKRESIDKYNHYQLNADESLHYYLKNACRYPAEKEYNKLFENPYPDFKNEYLHNWLYYASRSPIWYDRISKYDGKINNDTKTIVFPDEDKEEEFYNEWNLEPDEQPDDVKSKSIGNDVKQATYVDFCKKYGAKIVISKPALTNRLHPL